MRSCYYSTAGAGLQFLPSLCYNCFTAIRPKEVRPVAPGTKLALASSLKKLLQKKFLDDITVKELVEDCEVNRQTFYYHFQDIYDLLQWFLEHEAGAALEGAGDWREALLAAFRYIQDQHMVVYHVYRSGGRDHLLDCPFRSLARAVARFDLQSRAGTLPLSDGDRDFLTDFYTYALAGIMAQWFAGDMREPPGELAGRLSRLLESALPRAVERFSQSSE